MTKTSNWSVAAATCSAILAIRTQTSSRPTAKIINVLDDRKLSVRAAEKLTGVAASEFSRIRNAKLGRFTLDRMITILGKLGQDVDVQVSVRPRTAALVPQPG